MTRYFLPGLLAAAALFAPAASAQMVVSAQSGTVHHAEGKVLIDNEPVKMKFGVFPSVKQGQILRTEEGRAEVLLTPGAFLRVAENSAIRMVSNQLADTRIEVLEGQALLEVAELLKDNAVSLQYKDKLFSLRKKGLYGLNAADGEFRTYEGEAVLAGDKEEKIKGSHELALNGSGAIGKFDKDDTDPLYRWSSRRSGYLATASAPAARNVYDQSLLWNAGGWSFNPAFGMFTYLPGSGFYNSPFGYQYWSPSAMGSYGYYYPRTYAYYPGYGTGNTSGAAAVASRRAGPGFSDGLNTNRDRAGFDRSGMDRGGFTNNGSLPNSGRSMSAGSGLSGGSIGGGGSISAGAGGGGAARGDAGAAGGHRGR